MLRAQASRAVREIAMNKSALCLVALTVCCAAPAATAAAPECDDLLRIEKANALGSKPFIRVKSGPPSTPEHVYCSYYRADKGVGMLAANITADPRGTMWPHARDRYLRAADAGLSGEPLPGVGTEAVYYVDKGRGAKDGTPMLGVTASANGRIYDLMLRMAEGSSDTKRAYLGDTLKHMIETLR